MKLKHGEHTGKFGCWLTHYLKGVPQYCEHLVYYDHGKRDSKPNVAAIKGFYGVSVKNENRLADVDLIIAKPNKDIILLVEIEEKPSSPKKILGDVLAILMCNHFAVKLKGKQHYFNITPETELIIAGVVPNKGHRLKQINEVIRPRLQQFTAPNDSINPKNIIFMFRENISCTIEALKEKIKTHFRKPADYKF